MAEILESDGLLVFDKEELKQIVKEKLEIGKEFLTREIINETEYKSVWDSFIEWDNYNMDLIKQAFEKITNSHALEYKKHDGSGWLPMGGTYVEPTFQEKVSGIRVEMNYQVKKLQRFYNKIDLLKSKDNIQKIDPRKDKFNKLLNLLSRFHKIAQAVKIRRSEREPLVMQDEYDVQDFLNALLQIYFDDIRKEESSPSNAGSNSRLDFVLKNEKIILEIKMTRKSLSDKKLGEELLIDISRYKSHPDCLDLVIFIYDKDDHIINKKGFISDLQKQSTESLKVTVIISPE